LGSGSVQDRQEPHYGCYRCCVAWYWYVSPLPLVPPLPPCNFQHTCMLCFTLVSRGSLDCAKLPDLVSTWSHCVESWVRDVAGSCCLCYARPSSSLVPILFPVVQAYGVGNLGPSIVSRFPVPLALEHLTSRRHLFSQQTARQPRIEYYHTGPHIILGYTVSSTIRSLLER